MAAHHGHTLIINTFQSSQTSIYMYTSHVIGNTVVWVRYQVQLKPACSDLHLEQLDLGSRTVVISK